MPTEPTEEELIALFDLKHRSGDGLGWSPALRLSYNYFNPDDVYEALVRKLVKDDSRWLDAGCGRNLFPWNTPLSEELSSRAELLVGVDPDDTIHDNPYVDEKAQYALEDYEDSRLFTLVTLRMVAEHVVEPEKLVKKLGELTQPGGLVVVYTVNKYSPIPLITNLVPFSLHNPIKRIFWGTEPEDTFPTAFKMNTRKALDGFFSRGGFVERLFIKPDDCRTFSKFRILARAELVLRKFLRAVGLSYPEKCLIGVYEKLPASGQSSDPR
jgi:SAM-dependent methyltransferase